MSTITLTNQLVLGLTNGDTLVLPSTSESGSKQVSLEVVGTVTLQPASGGKINGVEGNATLTTGNYVLSTSGGVNATWNTLQGETGGGGVTSIVAGTGITIDPIDGLGDVTINATGGGGGLWSGTTVHINATTDGPTYNVPAGVSQVLIDSNNFEDPITVVLPAVSGMTEGTAILIGIEPNYTDVPLVTVEANASDTAWGIYSNGDYTLDGTAWFNYSTFIFVANPDIETYGDGYQWILFPDGTYSPNDINMGPPTSLYFWPQGSTSNDARYRFRASTEIPADVRSILIKDTGTSPVQLGLVNSSGGADGNIAVWNAGPTQGGYFEFNSNRGAGDKFQGTVALSGGTATVSTTAVTANSLIFLTNNSGTTNAGVLTVSARSAGVSFTITSSNGSDANTIAWWIVEP